MKRANLVRTDQQAVHKIIGKIVQPPARALAIDLGAPGMIVVARRTPCKLSRQIVAQCMVDLRQPFFLALIFDCPGPRLVARPVNNASASFLVGLADVFGLDP